jgi:hypothetical protein
MLRLGSTFLSTLIILAWFGAIDGAVADDLSAMRGANYVPSYARNDVAIWMDYDSAVIDRELGYAQRLNLNTVRIFLNQAVFERDPNTFLERLEDFLSLCEKYQIRAMPVLFDSCFDPQTVDLTDYRNRSWMPSPGFSRLSEADRPAMAEYIHAVVGGHRNDQRIALWDVMNEPESTAKYGDFEQHGRQTINDFVRWSLRRVREEDPSQPLTVGWASPTLNLVSIDLVDVICIHLYCPHQDLRRLIQESQEWGRLHEKPVILNEFVGQPHQPIEHALEIVTERKIGWVFWELMLGKTQFTQGSAPYQGHIYPDGTCRSVREVAAILHPEGYESDPHAIAAQAGFRPRRFTEEGITFEGAWQRWNGPGPTGDRLWHAGNPDDSATKTVTGSAVAVVLKHGPDCGIASIAVDGRQVAEIDTFDPKVDWNRQTVIARDLAAESHTVVITVTGRKAPASSFRYVQVADIVGEP